MKPSELIRKAIPKVVNGFSSDAALYVSAPLPPNNAVYNAAGFRLVRIRKQMPWAALSRWRRIALFNFAAQSLEEEGR